jgi:hypothetical protein
MRTLTTRVWPRTRLKRAKSSCLQTDPGLIYRPFYHCQEVDVRWPEISCDARVALILFPRGITNREAWFGGSRAHVTVTRL